MYMKVGNTVVCKYFVVKNSFVGNEIHKTILHKNFNTNNNNEVYLCSCDIILEYYLATLTLRPSNNCFQLIIMREYRSIGQSLFSAGVWLHKTSKGDAEKGGNNISVNNDY